MHDMGLMLDFIRGTKIVCIHLLILYVVILITIFMHDLLFCIHLLILYVLMENELM